MKPHLPIALLAGLLAVVIVCVTVLAAMGSAVPDWFRDLAFSLVGGAAGVAVPAPSS